MSNEAKCPVAHGQRMAQSQPHTVQPERIPIGGPIN